MADRKHTSKQSHAAHFAGTLSVSQRNALRVILLQQHACSDLRHKNGHKRKRRALKSGKKKR
jgi:hypothetical protein